MIVLAIAGLILLIVFLAVPALQRNSRNTQRKNDVQAMLGAVSEFESNNAGALPTAVGGASPNLTLTGAAGTTSAGFNVGYYPTANVTLAVGAQAALGADSMRVVTGAICGAAGATTAAGASARSVATQYEIEGAGGLTPTCQNS